MWSIFPAPALSTPDVFSVLQLSLPEFHSNGITQICDLLNLALFFYEYEMYETHPCCLLIFNVENAPLYGSTTILSKFYSLNQAHYRSLKIYRLNLNIEFKKTRKT